MITSINELKCVEVIAALLLYELIQEKLSERIIQQQCIKNNDVYHLMDAFSDLGAALGLGPAEQAQNYVQLEIYSKAVGTSRSIQYTKPL